MKNLNMNSTRIATIVLAVLLVSSTFMILSTEVNATVVNTYAINPQINNLSYKIDPSTGLPYGNLSQYEWTSAGQQGNTRFGSGPAPDSPSLLWTQADIGTPGGTPTAFDGMVFATSSTGVRAFNATTGAIIWNCTVSMSFPGFVDIGFFDKINNQIGAGITSTGPQYINLSNGFAFPKQSITGTGWTTLGTAGSAMYWGCMFDDASKCMISVATNSETGKTVGVCINCTNYLNPYEVWQHDFDTGLEALGFGGGNAYFGGYGEGIIFAINLVTGQQVWTATKPGNAGYSITFYNGNVYHSSSSTQVTEFDGSTGATLNHFDVAGGRAFYVYGMAAAYGRIFAQSIQIPQSWVGCWDASNLAQQWKAPAMYDIAYLVGAVADRKFIISIGDYGAGTAYPGYGIVSTGYYTAAFDAFTGNQVWCIKTSASVIGECIAYGNMYVNIGSNTYCYSDLACVPMSSTYRSADLGYQTFHGAQDLNGTVTGTVNGTFPEKLQNPIFQYKADGSISGSPVVVGGYAYFGTTAGTLYCMDSIKGTVVWSQHYNCSIYSTPTVVNGTVFTGADNGYVYALNATTGAQIWVSKTGGVSTISGELTGWLAASSPVAAGNNVYVGAQDGKLYCLSQVDGSKNWSVTVSPSSVGNGGTPCVHTDNFSVTWVYMMANGYLWQICANNGTVWNSVPVGIAGASYSTPVFAYGSAATNTYLGYVFVTYGQGPTSMLAMYNATNLALLGSIALSKTPSLMYMAQTVAYINPATVNLVNQSNIGWGTDPTSQLLVNQTHGVINEGLSNQGTTIVGGYKTLTAPMVYVAEGTNISCFAVIANGTNIGPQAGYLSSGVTNFIVNNTNAVFYFVRLWSTFAGNQIYSSPIVASDPTVGQGVSTSPLVPTVYLGSDIFGISAYNATSGALFSTYLTSPIYSTVALYDNRVYMTTLDGTMYCFANIGGSSGYYPTSIYADSSKGSQMALGEQVIFQGAVTTTVTFTGPYDSTLNQVFTQTEVPYANVTLTWVNPDKTSQQVSTMADSRGNFNITYTPTQTGTSSWLVLFNGYETSGLTVLGQSYTSYQSMNVLGAQPTQGPTAIPTPTQGTTNVIPSNYVYAIVGVIVALVIIGAIVMLLRRRKK